MDHRMSTLRIVFVLAGVVLLASATTAAGSEDNDALRDKIEAFQKSLKLAWEADDRDAVLEHFQHGKLLPPTRREYRMLGRMRFWDRPLKSAVRESDGAIRAEFIMDPESDSPAQTITLTLVESPEGRILVKSEATPEQLDAGRRLKAERDAAQKEIAQLELELAARPALKSALLPSFVNWFWGRLDERAKKTGEPIPKELRESVVLRPLGEIHRGDKAALFIFLGGKKNGRMETELGGVGFEKRADAWELVEDRLFSSTAVEGFLGTAGERQVVRRAALAIERIPAFYLYALGVARERFAAAVKAGDASACADLLENTMAGFPLVQVREVSRKLDDQPEAPDIARLGKTKVNADHAIVTLELVSRDRTELETLGLAREGEGWVILGRHTTPSEKTKDILDSIGMAVRDFKKEQGALPRATDIAALKAALHSHIPEMPIEDGWGTRLRYAVSADGKSYRIISAGADKTFNHQDWDPAPRSFREQESSTPDEDIVFENGRFIRWHKDGIW